MCSYVALANVALGLRALQLLVPEILVMNLVCRLLQILHVCPVCVYACVCVFDKPHVYDKSNTQAVFCSLQGLTKVRLSI